MVISHFHHLVYEGYDMLPGVEISTILDMVLNADKSEELERILTDDNIREANFVKNLLWVAADPNYEEGTDAHLDSILSDNELDNSFLQGMMLTIVMVLAAERPFYSNNPNHMVLAKLYEAAHALYLEQAIE